MLETTSENSGNSAKKPKRLDVQGIRGIAIIFVLGFHFAPKIFPNGYVGVDQFFVLSGFLMCTLLKKSKFSAENASDFFLNFYTRRLKRILPLYYLVIFLGVLAIFTIFPYTAINSNIRSGKKSLVFMSNQVETDENNYFALLSMAIDIFTHTWSLSVEVQFYFLIPFLYLFGAKISEISKNLEIVYYGFLGVQSFLYSRFWCSENEAFHSVWARIWQFSVGIVVCLLSISNPGNSEHLGYVYTVLPNSEDSESSKTRTPSGFWKKVFKYSLTVAICIFSFFYLSLPSEFLRPFITICTGVLIYLGKFGQEEKDSLLQSRILTYVGDISYSLYLFHWPIYAFWKLTFSHGDSWNRGLFLALASSIVLAILTFETFEKWYLSQSTKTVFIISSVLLTLNLLALFQKDVLNWYSDLEVTGRLDGLKDGEHMTHAKAEELNRIWSIEDMVNLRAPSCEYPKGYVGGLGHCKHTGLSGKYKIMIVGNSWAANHARLLYQECGRKAKSMIQQSFIGCEPLYPWHEREQENLKDIELLEKLVADDQPDYLFVISRALDILDPPAPNIKNITDDPVYQKMKAQLEIYSKSVNRRVFVMNQIPRIHLEMVGQIAETVEKSKNLTEFDNQLILESADTARLRYHQLGQECSKCEIFDYKPYFFNETTQNWRFYDEEQSGLSYMTQGIHLTFHGLELIRPVIREICHKL